MGKGKARASRSRKPYTLAPNFTAIIPRPSRPSLIPMKSPFTNAQSRAQFSSGPSTSVTGPSVYQNSNVQSAFRFLSLPDAVRTRIYKLVLQMPHEESHQSTSKDPYCTPPFEYFSYRPEASDLNLLLVSKQIHREAWNIYYRINDFHFYSTTDLYHFLARIGHDRRQEITGISFYSWHDDAERALELLSTCANLERMRFHLSFLQPAAYAAIWDIRGIKDLKISYNDRTASYGFGSREPNKFLPYGPELESVMTSPRLPEMDQDVNELPEIHQDTNELPESNQGAKELPEIHQGAKELPEIHRGAKELPEIHQGANELPEIHQDANKLPEMYPEMYPDMDPGYIDQDPLTLMKALSDYHDPIELGWLFPK